MTNEIIAYYRVSTEKQARSGLGLEAQKKAVAELAAQRRLSIVGHYIERESGKRSDRPRLQEAIAHTKRIGGTLVIARLDRLARNLHFVTGLQQAGVDFLACDMPEADRFTIQILAAVAEKEARDVGERTRAAMAAGKARGVKYASAIPGFWDGKEHIRLAAVRKAGKVSAARRKYAARLAYAPVELIIKELREKGATFAQIANYLTEHQGQYGLPRGGATHWDTGTVHRVHARAEGKEEQKLIKIDPSILAEMRERANRGDTCDSIAQWLNNNGIVSPRNKQWTANTVWVKLYRNQKKAANGKAQGEQVTANP